MLTSKIEIYLSTLYLYWNLENPFIMEHIKKTITVDILKLNKFSFVILLLVLILIVFPFFLLWKSNLYDNIVYLSKCFSHTTLFLNTVIVLSILIVGIILHELIHCVTWAAFSEDRFKAVKFGFNWKTCTPYSHCRNSMLNKHYILSTIMPLIILGVIPSLFALIYGNLLMLIYGLFFIISASGDILLVFYLFKENMNSIIKDHPNKIGFYVCENSDC